MHEDIPAQRERMLREIEAEYRLTRSLTGRETMSEAVERALREVRREDFVPEGLVKLAYDNTPLPIGHGQTISQPYIVALMTDLLALESDDRVLEVGTGCGYQAAILSRLVREVYTVEVIPELGKQAAQRLARLGYDNVHCRVGDGYRGWKEYAPYDAIMVTAAARDVPPALIEQLRAGGRLVIPLSRRFGAQQLVLLEKDPAGRVTRRDILPVSFVPMTGGGENAGDADTEQFC